MINNQYITWRNNVYSMLPTLYFISNNFYWDKFGH